MDEAGRVFKDGTVKITAFVMNNTSVKTKEFTVKVKAADELGIRIKEIKRNDNGIVVHVTGDEEKYDKCVLILELYSKGKLVTMQSKQCLGNVIFDLDNFVSDCDRACAYVRDEYGNTISPVSQFEL